MAVRGDSVARGFRNFLNEAMSAEDAELSGDLGGKAALFERGVDGSGGVELLADIAIAKAGDGELAMGDGFEQSKVVRIA